MKIKQRVLALMLSLAMVLTFMPALAFTAYADEDDFGDLPAESEIEELGLNELKNVEVTWRERVATFKFIPAESGQYVFESYGEVNSDGKVRTASEGIAWGYDISRRNPNFRVVFNAVAGTTYYLQVMDHYHDNMSCQVKCYAAKWVVSAEEEDLTYLSYYGPEEMKVLITGSDEGLSFNWYDNNDKLVKANGTATYAVTKGGHYYCIISDNEKSEKIDFYVSVGTVIQNNVIYNYDPEFNEVYVYSDWGSDVAKGDIIIPDKIIFGDGVARAPDNIFSEGFKDATELTSIILPNTIKDIGIRAFVNTGLKNITIPESVIDIGDCAVGYTSVIDDEGLTEYVKLPDFVIYGKKGTAAETYAIKNGFTFIEGVAPTPTPTPSPAPTPTPAPTGGDKIKNGSKVTVSTGTYKVISVNKKTAAFAKAKNKKAVTVPATVKLGGKTYKVTTVNASAFKESAIRTVTIGKNVKKIYKSAFKGSKAKKIILKTKLLKKSGVKGSLAGSRVTTVQVSVGSKAVNKKYVRAYKKIFTKANAGRKVTVK